ncbi:MAG: hypothetical protein ABTQ73_00385 [Caldilineales bacterium]
MTVPSRLTRSLRLLILLLVLLWTTACNKAVPAPISLAEQTAAPLGNLPLACQGDGAVQTWLLLPADDKPVQVMEAYAAGQVIELEATVVGQDDAPALQPHRRLLLRDAAEGIGLWLDYQGDPPPLVQGMRYRFVAWADLRQAQPTPMAGRPAIPLAARYAVAVYDRAGLLFLGLTDVAETDISAELPGFSLQNGNSDCPAMATNNACVASRSVLPLQITWGEAQVMLYPGEDAELAYGGARYTVELFRNRQTQAIDPPCTDYFEHQRSLRLDRFEPAPFAPAVPIAPPLSPVAPITATVPISTSP